MLDSAILDVAIAVIFTFLGVSLLTGALVEALASLLKWRSTTLKTGVMDLLNDPDFTGLAAQLYAHGLISPRAPGLAALPAGTTVTAALANPDLKPTLDKALARNLPAYINSGQFAAAMTDLLAFSPTHTLDELNAAVDGFVDPAKNPQLNQMLHGMLTRTQGDFKALKQELAGWFDNAMARVSGAYKRKTQAFAFLAALVIATLANADPILVAQRVWAQPSLVAGLQIPGALPTKPVDQLALMETLPIGWTDKGFFHVRGRDGSDIFLISQGGSPRFAEALLGWLITAAASLFGAPFWFDTLQRFVRLKGSGPSPQEQADNTAAAN